MGCSFTGAIISTLEEDKPLSFSLEWNIPEELARLIQKCVGNEPKMRPSFDLILQELVIISSQFPRLSEIVIEKKNLFEYDMLPGNLNDLTLYQLENFLRKRAQLLEKRKTMDIQAQKLRKKIEDLFLEGEAVDKRINELSLALTPVS